MLLSLRSRVSRTVFMILMFFISAVAQGNVCQDLFAELSVSTISMGSDVVVADSSNNQIDMTRHLGFEDIETSKKGLVGTSELKQIVLGNIAYLLSQASPGAQRSYLKLFGQDGVVLNDSFFFTFIDGINSEMKSHLRSLVLGTEALEPDDLNEVVDQVSQFIHEKYLTGSNVDLADYYKARKMNSKFSGLRKRNFKRFYDSLNGSNIEGSSNSYKKTGKELYSELLRQAVLFSLLELNFLNKSQLTAYEYEILYRANSIYQNPSEFKTPLMNTPDGHPKLVRFVKGVGHAGASTGFYFLGDLLFPGASLALIGIQQASFRNTQFRTMIVSPLRRLVKSRRLKKVAESIEGQLASGGFVLASPANSVSISGAQALRIGQGELNGVHDPARFEIPAELQYSEEQFREDYEAVKDDPESIERLIVTTIDKFGLKMNTALAQSELEDRDFFRIWGVLEGLRNAEQYKEYFSSLTKRKDTYGIIKARSDYLWAQRKIVMEVERDVEAFKSLIEGLDGVSDPGSLIEVVDARVATYLEFKNEFTKNSKDLLKIAQGILDESFDEPRDLVQEDDNRGFRIRLLPKHHKAQTGTDIVVADQDDNLVEAQVIEEMKHPAYEKFENRDDLPRDISGSSDTYTHPTLGGYPIVVDQVDSRVLQALCKNLGKAARVQGIRGHLETTYRDSYTGPVAKIQSYKRWGNKYEVIVEQVEASGRVVYELKCY